MLKGSMVQEVNANRYSVQMKQMLFPSPDPGEQAHCAGAKVRRLWSKGKLMHADLQQPRAALLFLFPTPTGRM